MQRQYITGHNEVAAVEAGDGIGGWWYILALLLPIAGFAAGIYWLAKSRVGPGLALWATSIAGWILAVVLIYGA